MGRFNAQVQITPKNPPKVAGVSRAKPDTVNKGGGEAYSLPLRHEIAAVVLNSMLNDSFYSKAQENLDQLQSLIEKADMADDLEFVAKTAVYARHVHGLRTVSAMLAGELGDRGRGANTGSAKAHAGDINAQWRKTFYEALPQRPDDITEILAYWNARHPETRHPNAMTRGFGKALLRFDAYALAKYKGQGGKEVNLVDAVNVSHPRPPKKHPIGALMTGKLAAADTWEKALSAAGNVQAEGTDEEIEAAKSEAKGAEWARLLSEKKLGYLAVLRNLRNIIEQAPDSLGDALAMLQNEKSVINSRIFPFQFRKAYDIAKEIGGKNGKMTMQAIARAADIALANVPKLPGRSLVVVDDSQSMTQAGHGGEAPIKIAAVFAAALMKGLPDADYMQFSTTARYIDLDTVGLSMFAMAEKIENSLQSSSTVFTGIFAEAARKKRSYDRIIILSDMQGWGDNGVQDAFRQYTKASVANGGPVPKLFSFDLKTHGTAMFPSEQVCLMAGFSDKVFTIMGQLEQDKDALVKAIEAVDFGETIKAQEARVKARTANHVDEFEKKAETKARKAARKKTRVGKSVKSKVRSKR